MIAGASKRPAGGFTLIEILVALAVFSVMSVMAYGGLHALITARDRTEQAATRLSELQLALLLMQQDMEHMAPRSIRDEYGEPEPALAPGDGADYVLTFTRGGNNRPRRPFRSGLQRVAYQLEDGELQRLIWPVLDRGGDGGAQKMVLLRGVTDLAFSFLGGEWWDAWPPPGSKGMADALPRAVEVVMTIEEWGTVRRLFTTPTGVVAPAGPTAGAPGP